MDLNIGKEELKQYLSHQLNNIYPDSNRIVMDEFDFAFRLSLDRLENCFKKVRHGSYNKNGIPIFNYLYSDHYLMFLWFLSNSVWKETGNKNLASKLYYLNKTLHGFDCMYDTGLPDIFLIFHGTGTMLGKAQYSDYFISFQGCTIGAQKGNYPKIGKGVALTAHSSVIGNCQIADRVTISAHASVIEKDIPADSIVVTDRESGRLIMKPAKECYAQQYFIDDLMSV